MRSTTDSLSAKSCRVQNDTCKSQQKYETVFTRRFQVASISNSQGTGIISYLIEDSTCTKNKYYAIIAWVRNSSLRKTPEVNWSAEKKLSLLNKINVPHVVRWRRRSSGSGSGSGSTGENAGDSGWSSDGDTMMIGEEEINWKSVRMRSVVGILLVFFNISYM